MGLIKPSTWKRYKNVIGDLNHRNFMQETILWHRFLHGLDYNGEDNLDATTQVIELKGLMVYNEFRNWPITDPNITGELDDQSAAMYFSMKYLRDNGYINANNNFDFDPGRDLFQHQKIMYKPRGDTPQAQAQDEPLIYSIVCDKLNPKTSETPR